MIGVLDVANIIQSKMQNIDYGWIDKRGIKHSDVGSEFSDGYFLRNPEQIIKSNIGICWDQVEAERYLFSEYNVIIKSYFIVNYDGKDFPSHTWLTFKDGNFYYWFEHSWEIYRGIHRYESENDLIHDVYDKFKLSNRSVDEDLNNFVIYRYEKPAECLSALEFYNHCESYPVIN